MPHQLSLFSEEKVQKQVYEFLIVINLPDSIKEYVDGLKDEFCERFGYFPSRGSIPHITISKFPLVEQEPDAVINYLQRSLQGMQPFRLEVDGFNSFPNNSRVIYLNVVKSVELDNLKVPFAYLRESFKPKKYFFILKDPHITIARGLRPDIFAKAEKGYLSKTYVSSFLVDKLNVLRREVKEDGKRDRYEHVCSLILGEEQ